MLVIRQDQMKLLSRYSVAPFLERVFIHVKDVFPEEIDGVGEGAVRETIRNGVNRAAEYGFTTEYDVVRYIDLISVFGTDFDQNPILPRFKEILQDNSYDNPTYKMDELVEAALEYADQEKE